MLNFFNLDVHISVISDIKYLLNNRIKITNLSLSGHAWVMNRNIDKLKIINQTTWLNIDSNLIQKFQREYDTFLRDFDGFIVGHPNVFILLYEKYNKPIIMINSCRYDMPACFTKNKSIIQELNNCITRLQSNGLLTIISNNLADKKYLELGVPNVKSIHVPSLCDYTGMRYSGIYDKFLLYSGESCVNHPLIKKRSELGRFNWEELGRFKGIIHIPYEASTMSIFEHISSGIPLFFPTKELLKKLWDTKKTGFQSNYWGEDLPDYLSSTKYYDFWLDNADYYQLKGYYYFDTFDNLFKMLENFKDEKREERLTFIKDRREYITTFWNTIKLPENVKNYNSYNSKNNMKLFFIKYGIC